MTVQTRLLSRPAWGYVIAPGREDFIPPERPTVAKPKRAKCAGTKKNGDPCGAWALKPGTVIEGVEVFGDHCRAHDPDLPDSARFGSKEQATDAGNQGGRPRQPRVVDILREKAEEHANLITAAYFDALDATRPIMVGSGENAFVEEIPDHLIRLKAAEALNDRAYGKPKQISEITGPEGGPIEHVGIPDEDEFHQAAAGILAEAEAIKNNAA
ncbi:MAG: hypothetical protein J0H98_08110 [Solirubrobacterales bacterium]|nr:hypothetical protein [Solirubrobacterales bacterium]